MKKCADCEGKGCAVQCSTGRQQAEYEMEIHVMNKGGVGDSNWQISNYLSSPDIWIKK